MQGGGRENRSPAGTSQGPQGTRAGHKGRAQETNIAEEQGCVVCRDVLCAGMWCVQGWGVCRDEVGAGTWWVQGWGGWRDGV